MSGHCFLSALCVALLATVLGVDSVRGDDSTESSAQTPRYEKDFDRALPQNFAPWYSKRERAPVYLPQEPPKAPKPVKPKKDRAWHRSTGTARGTGGIIMGFFWAIFALFCLAVIVAIAIAARKYWLGAKLRKDRDREDEKARARRIETLAPEAVERYDDLFAAASEARARGDLRLALVYFFSWLLVEMDKREFILLDKGKTNLEFWRELEGFDELRSIYRSAMSEFERVYFGGVAISRDEFERVWELRKPFDAIMEKKDVELVLAAEEAKKAAAQAPTLPPAYLVLLTATLAFACLGCSGKRYWREDYDSPVSTPRSQSLNAETAYANYCRAVAKWEIEESWNGHLDPSDKRKSAPSAIFWFESRSGYRPYRPDQFSYRDSLFDDLRWSQVDPNPKIIEGDSDKRAREIEARKRAFERNLRRYANSDAADFADFTVTRSTPAFDKQEESVVEWLKAKPGRTFVFVAGDWDAYPYYLLDSRRRLLEERDRAEGDKTAEIAANLNECEGLIRGFASSLKLATVSFGRRREDAKRLLASSDGLQKLYFQSSKASEFEDLTFSGNDRKTSGTAFFDSVHFSEYGFDEGTDWDSAGFSSEPDSESDASPVAPPAPETPSFGISHQNVETSLEGLRRSRTPMFATKLNSRAFGGGENDSSSTSGASVPIELLEKRFIRSGKFSGDPSWTKDLPETAELRELCAVEPRGETNVLVALDGAPLICERKIGESKLLIVNSNSFLSNYGLISSANRALAARLTREIPNKSKVAFVCGNLDFSERVRIPRKKTEGAFSLMRLEPFTIFVWHAFALGVVFVFCCYPIFGRPKRSVRELTNDFGKHVRAYASELERLGARDWAREQIDAYENLDKRETL